MKEKYALELEVSVNHLLKLLVTIGNGRRY